MYYFTNFQLSSPVQDERFNEAEGWLKERSRQLKLPNKKMEHVIWQLHTCKKGQIFVSVDEKLTEQELKVLSKWTKEQCEDGIGRDFKEEFKYLDPEFYYDDLLCDAYPSIELDRKQEENIFEGY